MRGKIVEWRDERGFGFIEPESGRPRVFFHISGMVRGMPRPSAGTAVRFELESTPDGKTRAIRVGPVGIPAIASALRSRRMVLSTVALAVFPLLWLLTSTGLLPPGMPWIFIAMSALAVILYGLDKSAAGHGGQRTPEWILQIIALLGGWPGALLAQQWFRHKSSKRAFQIEFWLMVALNIGALGMCATPAGRSILAQMFR